MSEKQYNNIWELSDVTDLAHILQEHSEKYIITSIVLKNGDKRESAIIKRFLKEKGKMYPNMLFLYLAISEKNMGEMSLLKNDSSLYPLSYHINNKKIMVTITKSKYESMEEAFDELKYIYDADLTKFNKAQNNKTSIDKTSIEIGDIDIKTKKKKKNDDEKEESEKKSGIKDTIDRNLNILELTLAQKKLEDKKIQKKLALLQTLAQDHNVKILEDLKQRQDDENDIKEQEKKKAKNDEKIKDVTNKKKKK